MPMLCACIGAPINAISPIIRNILFRKTYPLFERISETLYAPSLKDTNDYHHKCDDQENVNGSAKCVRGDPPE